MFKLPIPTRLTDYLGEAVVWTVIRIETYSTGAGRDAASMVVDNEQLKCAAMLPIYIYIYADCSIK